MSTEKFEVGEKEKHYFNVEWGLIAKRLKIEQDGVIVFNKGFVFSPFTRKFKTEVGSSEPHHVEITAGPFLPIELTVDGMRAYPLL